MHDYVNEAALQAAIVRAISKKYPDSWIFHVVGNPYQVSGIPDLLVLVDGRFIALEVKHRKPGESLKHAIGRVTPLQRVKIGKINRAGGTAAAVMSVNEALDLIDLALQ